MNEILKKGGEQDMNVQENDNQTLIEDLAVDEVRSGEIQGGSPGAASGGVWKTSNFLTSN